MKLTITHSRVPISRFFGILALLFILFTSHSFAQEGAADVLLETSGLVLLTIASLGRFWALMYIAGHKKSEVVRTGPYSIMRHPLYFFSFIGVVGIGLASENVLVLAAVVFFYLSYYPFAVRGEEQSLIARFGQDYLDYKATVPAIVPDFSLYQAPDRYDVNMAQLLRSIGDSMWFVWIFILLHGIEALQCWGVIPVLLRFP